MRKWIVLLVISVLLITCFLSVAIVAAPPIRHDARLVINRTAIVLVEAQRAAKIEHKYLGLGNAIAHQQLARELFLEGNYREAIFHSFRARALAIKVIRENQGEMIKESRREQWEERYANQTPKDEELDLKIVDRKVRDEEAVRIKIDLDIKE